MFWLDRVYFSRLRVRAKPWWFFPVLFVVTLACASCNEASQQTFPSRGKTIQRPRITETTRPPLTDSAPPLLDVTPTVPTSLSQRIPIMTTPISTSPISYEAESSQNTLASGAKVIGCGNNVCSGGNRVGYIGLNAGRVGTLQFNNIDKGSSGQYTLTIDYFIAGSDKLTLYLSVNGESAIVLNVSDTPDGDTVGMASIIVNLNAGTNTIKFSNPLAPAPDIDRIVI
jgi:hypothetical protein